MNDIRSTHEHSLLPNEIRKQTFSSSITAPQDAHKRLVLQVYLGSNTLEFNEICR